VRIRKRFDARKFVREVFDLEALERDLPGIKEQMQKDKQGRYLVSNIATGQQGSLEAALVFFDALDSDTAFQVAGGLDSTWWDVVDQRADAVALVLNTALALDGYFLAFSGAPHDYGLYLYKAEEA